MDERANDPHVIAFINLITEVSSASVRPLEFVFFFSILLSVLVELGIWLAFDTVTSFVLPELVMQREHEVAVAQKNADTRWQSAADVREDKYEMDRVVRKARQTVAKAAQAKDRYDAAA